MIISASRRTDIPAFHARWFMNRIRAGYAVTPNPFNPANKARIDLRPGSVDAIVFWTRFPRPVMPYLDELRSRGYDFCFLFTITGLPRALEPRGPTAEAAARAFRELAARIGPERVIWRYDPMAFTRLTPPEWHAARFDALAREVSGATTRCVTSVMKPYRKTTARLKRAAAMGAAPVEPSSHELGELIAAMLETARTRGLTLQSCADELGLSRYGLAPGKCIDDEYLTRHLGIRVAGGKDPGQRGMCRCAPSRDVGMYESCLFGCVYCYAITSFERARRFMAKRDLRSPSLLGWSDAPPHADSGREQAGRDDAGPRVEQLPLEPGLAPGPGEPKGPRNQ